VEMLGKRRNVRRSSSAADMQGNVERWR
jgi:hypothetical protein